MSTLHRIREFVLAATLGVGALIGSAAPACETPKDQQASIALFVDLGQMTVVASRDVEVASLGSMTVTAQRLPGIDSQFADLGAMTVTAPRATATHVADLGSITVAASRIKTVTVAARASDRNWN
jgi:hypothetical protein